MHRVSITLRIFVHVCKYYQAPMHIEIIVIFVYLFQENKYYQALMHFEIIVIFVYLFQENKSYGDKPFAFIL